MNFLNSEDRIIEKKSTVIRNELPNGRRGVPFLFIPPFPPFDAGHSTRNQKFCFRYMLKPRLSSFEQESVNKRDWIQLRAGLFCLNNSHKAFHNPASYFHFPQNKQNIVLDTEKKYLYMWPKISMYCRSRDTCRDCHDESNEHFLCCDKLYMIPIAYFTCCQISPNPHYYVNTPTYWAETWNWTCRKRKITIFVWSNKDQFWL